jgi:hypothetical protein
MPLCSSTINYADESLILEDQNPEFFYGNIDNIETIRDDRGRFNCTIDDYAFLRLSSQQGAILNLRSTVDVQESDHLVLVIHSTETGEQIEIDCKRYGIAESASVRIPDGRGVYQLNIIQLTCDGQKSGHSGGPVIHAASGDCIGFLHAGSDELISIIKAQTIPERFRELQSWR